MPKHSLVLLIGFAWMMALTGARITCPLRNEISFKAPPKDRLSLFRLYYPGVLIDRHKRLYPESDLTMRFRRTLMVWF